MLSEHEYNAAMQRIEHYLRRDITLLSPEEEAHFNELCGKCEQYESINRKTLVLHA